MVDKYFLYKIEQSPGTRGQLKALRVTSPDDEKIYWIQEAKKFGFSDGQIAYCMKTDHLTIRRLRAGFT